MMDGIVLHRILFDAFCVVKDIAMLLNNTFEEIVLINCDLNYIKN